MSSDRDLFPPYYAIMKLNQSVGDFELGVLPMIGHTWLSKQYHQVHAVTIYKEAKRITIVYDFLLPMFL